MAGPATLYQAGIHSARPANGSGCVLYSCTTHDLVYRDDGTSWTTFMTLVGGSGGDIATDTIWDAAGDLAVGSGANTAAKLTLGSSGTALVSNGSTAVWGVPALSVAKVGVTTDVSVSAASYTDVFSLALGAGTWDLWAYMTTNGNATNPGAAYNTYAELVTGASTRIAQNVIWTPKYGASPTLTPYQSLPVAAFDIAGSQTIKLRCYCDVATAVMGSTTLGTGAGTVLRAIRTA
jgi:hypothetical protein